jgi:hypothetical protein
MQTELTQDHNEIDMETTAVELTKQETDQLAGLLDLATKAGGLQVAAVALPILAKLQQAWAAKSNTETNPQ